MAGPHRPGRTGAAGDLSHMTLRQTAGSCKRPGARNARFGPWRPPTSVEARSIWTCSPGGYTSAVNRRLGCRPDGLCPTLNCLLASSDLGTGVGVFFPWVR